MSGPGRGKKPVLRRALLLRRVLRRLAPPGAWTRHAMARDSDGQPLFNARDVQARSWCLSGAIACESEFFDSRWDFRTHFSSQAQQISELGQSIGMRGYTNSVLYNNNPARTQEDILDLLREAIRSYEAAFRAPGARWGQPALRSSGCRMLE